MADQVEIPTIDLIRTRQPSYFTALLSDITLNMRP